MNFGSLKQFLEFKIIKNELKFTAQCCAETSPRLQCAARWPTTVSRKAGWATARQPGPAAEAAHVLRARWRGHRAQDGVVARSLMAQWRLASSKVLGSSTMTKRQMCLTRRAEVGLTEVVARRRGGAAAVSSPEGGSAVTPASSGSYRGG
jgi:hypothetical protein